MARENYKIDLQNYQIQYFRDPVYLSGLDIIETYRALILHMPDVSNDSHIFLQLICNAKSKVWYERSINVFASSLSKWVSKMAKFAGLVEDCTNKSL